MMQSLGTILKQRFVIGRHLILIMVSMSPAVLYKNSCSNRVNACIC